MSDDLDAQWQAYLDRMQDRHLADAVDSFLGRLRDLGLATIPSAMPLESGAMQLAWDRGHHHFDVDVFADGSFDWFYMNRSTSDLAGTGEERETRMTDELVACAKWLAA